MNVKKVKIGERNVSSRIRDKRKYHKHVSNYRYTTYMPITLYMLHICKYKIYMHALHLQIQAFVLCEICPRSLLQLYETKRLLSQIADSGALARLVKQN